MTGAAPWRAIARIVTPTVPEARALVVDGATPIARDRFTIAAGARARFDGYLAALPVGYWRRHTDVDRVRLTLHVTDAATVTVRRSDAGGRVVWSESVDAAGGDVTLDIPLENATADGGWLWFEVVAGGADLVVAEPVWSAPAPGGAASEPASATVCITTLNRQDDCVGVLRALAEDAVALARIDRVLVVDQGTRRLRDADGFDAVAAALGDALEVIEQPNLGGSGGFSRGMLEAAAGTSTHALLLDDDVALEPDAILRLLAFAEHARTRTIVGAQMMSLVDPTVLHSFGEEVEPRRFWWHAVDASLSELDLAAHPLPSTPALHRRIDVDFNGWWMCLVPTSLIREIGAALPLFIKWDDLEYSLRAAAHGTPTVTLPAATVWHMPWTAKDDGLDWQAYFQLRNRLVAALLHARTGRGGALLLETLAQDVNHLLCLQYGPALLRRLALRDVLAGPAHLPTTLARRIGDGRALLQQLDQERVDDPGSRPAPETPEPRGAAALLRALARVLVHQVRPVRAGAVAERFTKASGRWWSLGLRDAALLESATGTGVFRLRRRRATALRGLWLAAALRVRLAWAWPRLQAAYRAAAPQLTADAAWRRHFEPGSWPDAT